MASGKRVETRAIHSGQAPDPATGSTIVPVYQTVTFTQDAVGEHRGYEYSRTANPTRVALEECLAALEGGRFGFAYGSGMAAIHGAMQLLSSGDHVVVADDLYGGLAQGGVGLILTGHAAVAPHARHSPTMTGL